MNPKIDAYLIDGCGRCPLGSTPQCKVNNWQEELRQLRRILLDCGLIEELKWGVPCYTFHNSNVVVMAAFKEYCSIGFFKGALLYDAEGILDKPGENTQASRLIRLTSVQQIIDMESILRAYIYEAIEVERAGLKVEVKKNPEPIPEEFQKRLDEDFTLQTAFFSLTPGRQRGYILHFSQPKQSSTRVSRIEKLIPKILDGRGFHD